MPRALITGGTAGIGLAFARHLAAAGHDLVLVARDDARLAEVARTLGAAHGRDVDVLAADLSVPEACRRVELRLGATDRPVDLLVNNAGFGLRKPFLVNDIDEEERMLDVLVRAPMRLSHAAARAMSSRGGGTIVNVSSIGGWIPRGTYSAHKAWLTTFSEALSAQAAASGVRVMVLCPGFVRTEFHQRIGGGRGERLPSWAWLDVDELVASALEDLAKGVVVSVPSLRYKAARFLLRHAPRRALVRGGTVRI